MNIFYLDNNPRVCAEMHNDKHCVKMILEYAQLLSTAHRILDGSPYITLNASGRKRTVYQLADAERDGILYSATHVHHPSAIWVRVSDKNYVWLQNLLEELCLEYTHRYGKIHKVQSSGLTGALQKLPNNIPQGHFTEPTPAMPDDCKVAGDSIASYKNYYIMNKTHLANWKKRPVPDWYITK